MHTTVKIALHTHFFPAILLVHKLFSQKKNGDFWFGAKFPILLWRNNPAYVSISVNHIAGIVRTDAINILLVIIYCPFGVCYWDSVRAHWGKWSWTENNMPSCGALTYKATFTHSDFKNDFGNNCFSFFHVGPFELAGPIVKKRIMVNYIVSTKGSQSETCVF